MSNFELTWAGPSEDLPLVSPGRAAKRPSPPGDPAKPLPKRGADAFDPRQTLISAPRLPNHPRQTLIRLDAPPEAPKFLPALPNIVVWNGEPVRPKLQLSAEQFARMHAKAPVPRQMPNVAVPELPNAEHNLADVNFAASPTPNLVRPALVLPAGTSTVAAPKQASTLSSAVEPPPSVAGSGEGNERILALSAMPAPVAPPSGIPMGNLSANVSISPEGKQPGSPGGSPNGAAGNGGAGGSSNSPGGNAPGNGSGVIVPGVSISGGNPKGPSGISGLGSGRPRGNSPSLHVTPGMTAPPSSSKPTSPANPPDASIAEKVKAGASPEQIFGEREFYTLHVNAPNTSSVSGSWILKFAELEENGVRRGAASGAPGKAGDLSGPVPIRKVDPRYPPAQRQARIQGEVVLYAIIRANGSVDSIQVLRSLDLVLDQNAMEALAEWKFQPATRNGVPVDLEAIIHIPFRSIAANY